MAGNEEEEDMYKFTLQFNQKWPLHQFIRAGRSKDPMNKNLRISTGDEYQDAMESGEEPQTKDFTTNCRGLIDPNLSWGLSAYTDETRLREVLGNVKNQTLWRVGLSDDAKHIFYPSEMQLKPDKEDPKHVGISPTKEVRPETLKEMLRCLPWVKLYPKDTQEEGKKKAK